MASRIITKSATARPQVADLKDMFDRNEAELLSLLEACRKSVVEAASTIQYDSADLVARQLGVEVPQAPFSRRQQQQTRFDGGFEEDGVTV